MLIGIAVLSYATAGLAFFLLSCLLLTWWRRPGGAFLTAACLMTSLWATAVAYHVVSGSVLSLSSALLELFRDASWIAFLFALLGPLRRQDSRTPFNIKPIVLAVAVLCLFTGIAAIFRHTKPDYALGVLDNTIGLLALAVAGMLLVEQVFRNAADTERWSIKFACFGIGAMFAYDFYLYSDAMLFRQINAEIWTARGLVTALIAPLIGIAAIRRPQWRSNIAVSRRFLFHSVALFGSATYLLAMAAAGYYLRFFGGNWGIVMQVAFLFGTVVLLAAVMFSGTFRSWLKVFISKHFYTYNYDYREEWIRFTRTLSENEHRIGERAVQAVAELVESPGGALWIVRESGNCEPAAHWNMFSSMEAEPADSPFCRFLEREQWIVDLHDQVRNPSKYSDLVIPGWMSALSKAWLVVPLIFHGKLFGFVVLALPRSAIKLNWEILDLLKIAGSQAASYLAQNESVNALMVARQFESFNRMSTFLVHDLKNLVSQLSLVLSNADRHKESPEFQKDMLETISYSVEKMKLMLQKFSRNSSVETPAVLHLGQLLERVVASKATYSPRPVLNIRHADIAVFANPARLERIIGHIIQNAIEATGKDGRVSVRLDKRENFALIEIEDTGQGMSEEFLEQRLFKPFESTKLAGMGIGVFEMREYVLHLGGKVEVASRLSNGTTFSLTIPVYKNSHYVAAAVA